MSDNALLKNWELSSRLLRVYLLKKSEIVAFLIDGKIIQYQSWDSRSRRKEWMKVNVCLYHLGFRGDA